MKLKYYFVFFVVLGFLVFSLHCVALEVTKEQVLQSEKEMVRYRITKDTPRESDEKLNRILERRIEEVRTGFLEIVSKGDTSLDIEYTLDITYQRYVYEKYISYCFIISTYTGGAHPNSTLFTIVYDTEKEEVVSLPEDALEIISSSVRGDLLMNPRIVRTDFMMSGTEVRIENFQNFVFTKEGILFFFPPYQVGPYSSGVFQSLVPWEEFL